MNKNKTWLVFVVSENNKYYAYARGIYSNDNLAAIFKDIKRLTSANICSTKKNAYSLVEVWNKDFKENGHYMFENEF